MIRLLVIATVLAAVPAANAQACLKAGTEVNLTGSLTKDGSDASPSSAASKTTGSYILTLDKPVCFDSGSASVKEANTVLIATMDPGLQGELAKLSGKPVTISGAAAVAAEGSPAPITLAAKTAKLKPS